jgi:nucleoid-associated protein YgaU
MARKKAVKSVSKSRTPAAGTGVLDYFRFGDSYTSLVLGIVVVILAVVLVAALFRSRDFSGPSSTQPEQEASSTKTGPDTTSEIPGETGAYTVKSGDTLWSIAETSYKDGYRWVEIAKINNIASADVIAVGTKLTLPKKEAVAKPEITSAAPGLSPPAAGEKIVSEIYTIKSGDTLWDISVRTYGTGYKWPEIARQNNLVNPNLIFTGSTLKLPKS